MIVRFKHKGLENFFLHGSLKGIIPSQAKRLKLLLFKLHTAQSLKDLEMPGAKLHPLKGNLIHYFSLSVNGNWRLIFRWQEEGIYDVDILDYH